MEFFDKLVIPQSLEHIELLKSLSVVMLMILLPYLGVLLGSSFFSVIFFKKGKSTKNKIYLKFSKDLIDLITVAKSSAIALSIIPMFSYLLLYSQLLQGSGASISNNLTFTILIMLAAVFSIYTYKYSFRLSKVLNAASVNEDNSESDEIKDDLINLKSATYKLLFKSGVFGVILLFIASYLFIGITQFVNNSSRWSSGNSILNLIFSSETIIYFFYFLSASLSITGAFVLYKYLKSDYDGDDKYKDYVQKFSLKTVMIFILVMPLLMFIQVTTIPKDSLSNYTFIFAGLILLVLFLISIYLYFMIRESHLKYRSNIMFLMLVLFGFMILQLQSSFDTTSQLHDKVLEASYSSYLKEFKGSLGIETEVPVSGEAIFKAKCSACHSFDKRIVGPPYNETLPQFENNMSGLEDFIAHPRKINPAYPAMPAQGLKPNEVKAIASYIMETYKKNKK